MTDEILAKLEEEYKCRSVKAELSWGAFYIRHGYLSKKDAEFLNWLCKAAFDKIKELEKQSLEKLGCKRDAIIKEKLAQDTAEKGCNCRLHGRWIDIKDGSYECEFCHHQITGIPQDLNFCCKCGAELKMI